MKNSGRFHACFSFLLLLKLLRNRTGGLRILKKAAFLVFWSSVYGFFHSRHFCMSLGFCARLLLVFSIFGQRFSRQDHGTRGKS